MPRGDTVGGGSATPRRDLHTAFTLREQEFIDFQLGLGIRMQDTVMLLLLSRLLEREVFQLEEQYAKLVNAYTKYVTR